MLKDTAFTIINSTETPRANFLPKSKHTVSYQHLHFKFNRPYQGVLGFWGNVLEAARASGRNPIVIYASTNKVYGGMEDVELYEEPTRWRYKDLVNGCPETQPLDFHSPVPFEQPYGE